jgi:CRISPR type III-B/RAMP module RAMP protein Cmr1
MNWKEKNMKIIKMTIELLSDTLSGSGEGFGAIIDTDIQYDKCGIPFISAKRIKGCLRNSLNDLLEMPAVSKARGIKDEEERNKMLNSIFGSKGSIQSSSFEISDFVVEDYEIVKSWFNYLKNHYTSIFSNEKILSTYTNIRKQTRVDGLGIAVKHSLRTSRVANKGLKFSAEITIDNMNKVNEEYLALACANLRRIGIKRNRGLGEIRCSLEGDIIHRAISNFEKELEEK